MTKTVDKMRRISKVVWYRVPGRRAGHRIGPTTEHRTAVSRHKQLTAAGGPQVLPTSDVMTKCGKFY